MYTIKLVRLGKTYILDIDNRWYQATNHARQCDSVLSAKTYVACNLYGNTVKGDYCYVEGPRGAQYPIKSMCQA